MFRCVRATAAAFTVTWVTEHLSSTWSLHELDLTFLFWHHVQHFCMPESHHVLIIVSYCCAIFCLQNKSAFLCGVMKTYRQREKQGTKVSDTSKGPDEAKIKVRNVHLRAPFVSFL